MGTLRQWFKNARSLSLAQSLTPAILAVVTAAGYSGFSLALALCAVVGVAFAHLAMNLTDDLFDYRSDMMGDRRKVIRKGFRAMTVKYPYLTDGSESLKSLRTAIASFFGAACVLGAVVFAARTSQNGFCSPQGSWWIAAIVCVTAFLGVFYSAPPLKLGFHGLGEIVIGVIFGPLLMMGVFYAAAGQMSPGIVWISIPVGLLVMNILYTHSFIEKAGDAESGKMTLALLLGPDRAGLVMAYILNILPFAMVVSAVCLGALHPLYLLVLLILPRALWLCSSLKGFAEGHQEVPQKPSPWLGPMMKWETVRESGVDWFLMRWLTARNTLSGFCIMAAAAGLILLIIS